MISFRIPMILMAVLATAPVAAQTQTPKSEHVATKNQRVERAQERCRQNRGLDCETRQGLKEWLLLERSREEAVRDGSRHLLPAQPRPAPPRR